MAGQATFIFREKKKVKRKGRHSKKASLLKNSKTYKKLYKGQGR